MANDQRPSDLSAETTWDDLRKWPANKKKRRNRMLGVGFAVLCALTLVMALIYRYNSVPEKVVVERFDPRIPVPPVHLPKTQKKQLTKSEDFCSRMIRLSLVTSIDLGPRARHVCQESDKPSALQKP